ncbi:MAG: glucosamine-6-phosphate deaminase [Clostridia bacterium]|nr:glucosamine-6-phosphate deaminase [Clostridia bacterium]
MKQMITEHYQAMSEEAGKLFAEAIQQNPRCVLGLATGDTPIGLYQYLIAAYRRGELDFSRVQSVNLDEYYPISPDNDQSYRYFMNEQLFDHVNIDKSKTLVPNGQAEDAAAFCAAYEEQIDAIGGIDIQVLGIGRNGHIGFNEPGDALIPDTHLTDLTEGTIAANSRFFASADDVPKQALTMGIRSIFKARKILVLASGKAKAEAVRAMLCGNITTKCPASLLCLHPDVTLICDEDAYSLMK